MPLLDRLANLDGGFPRRQIVPHGGWGRMALQGLLAVEGLFVQAVYVVSVFHALTVALRANLRSTQPKGACV
jgi:hypothetical protein